MAPLAGVAPALIARARADQVATIYASWTRTTASMLLGAALLGIAMWSVVPPALLGGWLALVAVEPALPLAIDAGLAARAPGARRERSMGTLLGDRFGRGGRVVGARRGHDVPGVRRAPGAADRVPVRRRAGRSQPDRRLASVVLRLRAAGAVAADPARRLGRRRRPSVHRAGAVRRARRSCSLSAIA